jgi:pSer/pThr/pTyr-binding forkhead associated (FHA) protein/S1-C subfamily serine protease
MADTASTQIVIRHTSGSKANRVDSLSLAGLDEIRIGRDPSNTIIYDSPGDDSVSRKHAVIKRIGDSDLAFTIEDLGSSNGTFVNRQKISSRTELNHGDVVTLGPNGPSFLFQLDPPPSPQMARTRIIEAAPLGATRVLNPTETGQAASEISPSTVFEGPATRTSNPAATMTTPTKVGVGRETMMLEISQAKRSAGRQWLALLSLVVAVALAGGGYLLWRLRQESTLRQSEVADISRQAKLASVSADAKVAEALAEARRQAGLSPQDIVRQDGPATALLSVQWRLYDQLTGRPIFLKVVEYQNKKYPLFVKNSDGSVTPWLTLDDEGRFNQPIEKQIQGTAFVISEQGYLLTNKHMAAGWRVPFFDVSRDDDRHGVMVSATGDRNTPFKVEVIDLAASQYHDLRYWIPETGGKIYPPNSIRQIGPGTIPSPSNAEKRDFTGRNDSMTIRFANTQISINATLVRSSDENDAALIKIDAPTALQKDVLADRRPTAGERVVVLGFPAVAEQRIAVSETIENGIAKTKMEGVPIPYVTEGIVAVAPEKIESREGKTIASQYGDLIQLTINATGAGNSGGPVFDSSGRVIGIFAAIISAGSTLSTAAVPIQYGLELLKSQH